MTVLLDTNVLLDVLLDRMHADAGAFILEKAREGRIEGTVTPTVLTNTFYVGRNTASDSAARDFIQSALSFLDVASVSHAGMVRAVRRYRDFEDGVIGETAVESGADFICTRNPDDFEPARSQVLTSVELSRLLLQ